MFIAARALDLVVNDFKWLALLLHKHHLFDVVAWLDLYNFLLHAKRLFLLFYFFAFSLFIFFLLFWFLNGTRDLLCPQIVCSAVAKISNEKQDLRNNDCVFLVAISIQWSALNANTWNQSPQEIGRLTTKICNTNFISCILLLFGLFLWHFLCRKQYSSASEL